MNATHATSITLSFTLEEARAFRTALGSLDILYDALSNDVSHVRDDESYGIDAARVEALFGLLDSAFTVLQPYTQLSSEAIDAHSTEERCRARGQDESRRKKGTEE